MAADEAGAAERTAEPRISGRTSGIAFGISGLVEVLDLEGGGAEGGGGVAVAVAAVGEETPGLFEAVLPAGGVAVLGAHVLDEEQAAAGFQHAGELVDRGDRVGDRAEDQGGYRGVEAAVLEGKRFGRGFDQARGSSGPAPRGARAGGRPYGDRARPGSGPRSPARRGRR